MRFNATSDAEGNDRKKIDSQYLHEIIGDAIIKKISIYTSPLQMETMCVLAHQFFVKETDKGYFSLETTDLGIEMQTHTDADVVTKQLGGGGAGRKESLETACITFSMTFHCGVAFVLAFRYFGRVVCEF